MFEPVALPTWSSDGPEERENCERSLDNWIRSEPVRKVAEAFGFEWNDLSPKELFAALDAFSAEVWDFRKGRERNRSQPVGFSPGLDKLIHEAADALGMVRPQPSKWKFYDHVLILGGLVRACILRPQYAASLIRSGLETREVTALGAFRSLSPDECSMAAAAGMREVDTEIEAMDEGVRAAFDLTHPVQIDGVSAANPHLSWLLRQYDSGNFGCPIRVIAAPSSDEKRRANTADTYVFWARSVADLEPYQRVLLITSTIYVPHQHIDAIRILGLPFGVDVETLGLDPSTATDPHFTKSFEAFNYLQELRSAIRAMRDLRETLTSATTTQ